MKEDTIQSYGIVEKDITIEPDNWTVGALEPKILLEKGQYDAYLPPFEHQARIYETGGCTVWGGQNQIEITLKLLFDIAEDYDERYNYILTPVTLNGANPHNTYECFRKEGLTIGVEPSPRTYEEFKDESYITSARKKQGKKWLEQYGFEHAWLKEKGSGDITKEDIMNALPYGPIACTVTAWHKEDGLYVDRGLDNTHWVVAYGYLTVENTPAWIMKEFDTTLDEAHAIYKMVKDGAITIKLFDSYDHSKKLLHPDHHTAYAKEIRIYTLDDIKKQVTLLERIVAALNKLIQNLFPPPAYDQDPAELPMNVEVPKVPPPKQNRSMIELWATAIKNHEGYGTPGAVTITKNFNPGALRYSKYQLGVRNGFSYFKDYETGWKALCFQLEIAATGKSKVYKPTDTLLDFFKKWAPSSDNNDPARYAAVVASKLGVTVDTQIQTLV